MASEPAAQARRRRAGIAAVEMAVVAPFLAIIIVGMFELSRAVMVVDLLDNAARKGCNTGIKPAKQFSDIVNDVVDVLNNDQNITTSSATISINSLSTTGPSLFVGVFAYQNTTTPSWSSTMASKDSTNYNPNQYDLVSVQVAVPATKVLWFTPQYFAPVTHALYSSQVVMMRSSSN